MIDLKFQQNIIDANGEKHQTLICMEECTELAKAASKIHRCKEDDIRSYEGVCYCKKNLIEEIADVQICISQLMLMHNITEQQIANAIDTKQDRQRARMEN